MAIIDNGELVRADVGQTWGAGCDLDELPFGAWPPRAETAATTLVWQRWASLLRLARALLDSPAARLSRGRRQSLLRGHGVLLAPVDDDFDTAAWDELRSGNLARITQGWSA